MKTACRNVIAELWSVDGKLPAKTANAGLIMDCCLKYMIDDKENFPDNKRSLLESMHEAMTQTHGIYKAAYNRYISDLKDIPSKNLYTTGGRMIIGLGNENVMETGITFNHTYGTPVIPGSALKGLAAHYCNQVFGESNSEFKAGGEYYNAIFGTDTDAGHIIFHDAWITPDSLKDSLRTDIMTPHHRDYYAEQQEGNRAPPTDFDDTNPVLFLSVCGEFMIVISCDIPDEKKWPDFVLDLLTRALSEWGIGGKTSSGYGRLTTHKTKTTKTTRECKHGKGKLITVTRIEDTTSKKGKIHQTFMADDGISGTLRDQGTVDVEIGSKCKLVVESQDSGGPNHYSFATPDSWNSQHNTKNKNHKRR